MDDSSVDEYKRKFGKRLQQALNEHDKSAHWLALKTNINATTIYGYINGDYLPRAHIIAQICDVLRCDANWLCGVHHA